MPFGITIFARPPQPPKINRVDNKQKNTMEQNRHKVSIPDNAYRELKVQDKI